MKEFGAEETSVPPEFVKEVQRFILQYQDRDRDLMLRALVHQRGDLERVQEILRRDLMPQDFAYMAVVESGFLPSSYSQEGAAGFWQFTETTAREYGMKVNESVDERLDLQKSTEAASRYIRDLILDFGTGSSVMLAMAAYNSGPETVRRAMRNVKDPIKQRNFWHLYQTRALPAETREYVPKVLAAIVVGRNPRQFGF
jgi:membrane-bound lytic murein transglycosylase D